MKKKILSIRFLIFIYVNALMVFFTLRLGFLFDNRDKIAEMNDNLWAVITSLWMGFRFDTVISLYILIIPVILSIASSYIGKAEIRIYKFITYFSMAMFSVAFTFAAANIPYYAQFHKTINSSILNWLGEPSFVIGMIFSEIQFLPYVVAFFLLDILFCYSIYKAYKRIIVKRSVLLPPVRSGYFKAISLSMCIFALCFIGIRGRLSKKSPIRIGTAYFSSNHILNNAGLNPNFVLIRTILDKKKSKNKEINVADEKDALFFAKEYFNLETDISDFDILRIERVTADKPKEKKNIVVILMESFSSYYLSDSNLTPFVKSLSDKGIFFPNTFSSGIHTMNGLYATLFSYPALLDQHPFKTGDIVRYDSWPYIMHEMGYSTYYFTTHDDQFDNIGGYMAANYFEHIISEKDYPANEVKSNLGVPDDYMFRKSFEYINMSASEDKPFMAAYLTASNHNPFIIPEYFEIDKNEHIDQNIVRYADWSLMQFFENASKQEWYDNTVFVLVGDHGSAKFNNLYDVSLCYHQVPFIIYDPIIEKPVCDDKLACQTDIFPTVMGYLGYEFVNSTFGINLFKNSHDYVYFSSDNAYQCISDKYYYVNNFSEERKAIYDYKNNNPYNYIDSLQCQADEMEKFASSMLQSAQYMVRKIQRTK